MSARQIMMMLQNRAFSNLGKMVFVSYQLVDTFQQEITHHVNIVGRPKPKSRLEIEYFGMEC